jgi:hypothetical protein
VSEEYSEMVNRDLEELNQMLQIWRARTQDDVNTGKDESGELEEGAAKVRRGKKGHISKRPHAFSPLGWRHICSKGFWSFEDR